MKTIWKQYIFPRLIIDIFFFYALLCTLGLIVSRIDLNVNFGLGAIANYLMLVAAFLINDIEDRAEDAHSTYLPQTWADNLRMMIGMHTAAPKVPGTKRFTNLFAHNILNVSTGYLLWGIIVVSSLILSMLAGGMWVFIIGLSNVVIGFLYSWHDVRLKSRPVLDLLSHAYLLAGVQIVYFLAYPNAVVDVWGVLIFLMVYLNSVSGDLRNEYRDFDEDQMHGIRNTATFLGKKAAMIGGQWLNIATVIGIGLLAVVRGVQLLR